MTAEESSQARSSLTEITRTFFILGLTAFGGPAAHIAIMEDEFVGRRRWLDRQHFLDLVGATNLIPGPNSTEVALHLGYERRGWPGLLAAGFGFLVPAVLLTTVLAYAYDRFGTLPEVTPWILGIQPVVLAILLSAVWKLGRKAVDGWKPAVLAGAAAVASLGGLDPVLILFGGVVLGGAWLWGAGRIAAGAKLFLLPAPALATTHPETTASLAGLALFFLKVGAVLYGSGYVLVAFIEGGLVQDLGWLTEQQLLDAVAVGQLTPGPVLSTAAFVGFLVAGFSGAGVSALAIFLPSFVFVVALNPLIPRLRRSPVTAHFLNAANAVAVGLMAGVLIDLARGTLTGWLPWGLAVAAAVALFRFRIAAPWLVAGGALAGGVGGLILGS